MHMKTAVCARVDMGLSCIYTKVCIDLSGVVRVFVSDSASAVWAGALCLRSLR